MHIEKLVVHGVDITHRRLIELARMADQAKPFYDWVERTARKITASGKGLDEIMMSSNRLEIVSIIDACHRESEENRPLLFDGIGRIYSHKKACFYFFSWMIRDAPQQRLTPLISRMRKNDGVDRSIAIIDTLSQLILSYRSTVKTFEWLTVREVILDRLEGSRRSIKGHKIETIVRTALVSSFQFYFSAYENYGRFKHISISEKEVKIGHQSIDLVVDLVPSDNGSKERILVPIKTRETEGGGHAHLFTRDINAAIREIRKGTLKQYIVPVFIALNWSKRELDKIDRQVDLVFYFNCDPAEFSGFGDAAQIRLNKFIQGVLSHAS